MSNGQCPLDINQFEMIFLIEKIVISGMDIHLDIVHQYTVETNLNLNLNSKAQLELRLTVSL